MLRQLHSVDSLFLHLDSKHSQMDVTPMYFYDPSTAADGVVTPEQIEQHLNRSIATLPILRSRLERPLLNLDNPYLVEDSYFDIRNHLHQIEMPSGADWKTLCEVVAKFQEHQLDLKRPPWEIMIVHGINGIEQLPDNCILMALKIHHVIVDGHTVMEMTERLHDEGLSRRAHSGIKQEEGYQAPELLGKLTRILSNNLLGTIRMVKPLVKQGPKVGMKLIDHLLRDNTSPDGVVRTRFNQPISDKKVWDYASFDLAEFKSVSKALPNATINHVVLATIAGALRSYLQSKGEATDQVLRAIAPINVRKPQQFDQGGNEIALFFPDLPIQIADPVERFKAVSVAATLARKIADDIGAEDLSDMAKQLPPAYVTYLTKLGSFQTNAGALLNHAGHTIVTNVPGPSSTLHLAGAKLVQMTGIAITSDHLGLLHAINSYAGRFNIAWTSTPEMMPDPEFYAECMRASFAELKQALLPEQAAATEPADVSAEPIEAATEPAKPRAKRAAAPRKTAKSAAKTTKKAASSRTRTTKPKETTGSSAAPSKRSSKSAKATTQNS
ncbi:wax ester/triacylglycerol synthase family O-acyltransferase [Motiliproteus coralliicola]|nr:wax ester/triacylglycerol synthase family O-acyltransferase [Motiliproteus coralliicola]